MNPLNPRRGGLESVLITERLGRRRPRHAHARGEDGAFAALSTHAACNPFHAPQKLVHVAMNLCGADSAGISVLRSQPQDGYLCWSAVAGQLAAHANVVTPRNFSPCGTVLDSNAVQLFYCPGRYFTYLNGLGAPVVELLVAPIGAGDKVLGTLWVASHDRQPGSAGQDIRQFDSTDAQVTVALAELVAPVLQENTALQAPARGGRDPRQGAADRLLPRRLLPIARRLVSSLRKFSP